MEIHIPADFTMAELQAFIEGEAKETPEGYYTAEEWAEHLRVSITTMRFWLKQAKRAGLLDKIRVRREMLDGRMTSIPAYALKKKDSVNGGT